MFSDIIVSLVLLYLRWFNVAQNVLERMNIRKDPPNNSGQTKPCVKFSVQLVQPQAKSSVGFFLFLSIFSEYLLSISKCFIQFLNYFTLLCDYFTLLCDYFTLLYDLSLKSSYLSIQSSKFSTTNRVRHSRFWVW